MKQKQVTQLLVELHELNKTLKTIVSSLERKEVSHDIFPGIAFKAAPVSKEEFVKHYGEYVKRCSN
ncbi:hypothetical protein RXV91_11045 [Lactiplantibacillus sp. DA1]|uniref:hypothetical protein n=1 Tax=Lactiplantibacillus sp. DA1 TaxID=3079857 RepID=UPI00292A6611|nr:hypothetical protein [Lactiplantibacillus sp. DA1]MDV0431403.1 hypothetical protein [Lactiplantibacillus sp. DA1]